LPHFSGWISYTISKAQRQIDDIAGGEWYCSPYDKPHNISVVLNYELHRWTFGANWVFASGQPVTYPGQVTLATLQTGFLPDYSNKLPPQMYPAFTLLLSSY
jgi:hypothetical protein